MLQHWRAIPLAIAAFASVATSAIEDGEYEYRVFAVSPDNHDDDVSPAAEPYFSVVGRDDDHPPDPAWVHLQTSAGAEVAGTTHLDGVRMYFVPDELLAPGDYTLILERQPSMAVELVSLDGDTYQITSSFTVRPPGQLADASFTSSYLVSLAFTTPIAPETLEGRVSCLDEAGQPVGVVQIMRVAPAIFDVQLDSPAVSCTVLDGVLDGHGFPVLGLPASF